MIELMVDWLFSRWGGRFVWDFLFSFLVRISWVAWGTSLGECEGETVWISPSPGSSSIRPEKLFDKGIEASSGYWDYSEGGSVSIVVRDWPLWSDRSERPAGPLIVLLPVLFSEQLLDCRRHLICLISDLIKCMSDLSLEFSDFILAFSALRDSFSVSRSCILEWRVENLLWLSFPLRDFVF